MPLKIDNPMFMMYMTIFRWFVYLYTNKSHF